jgi:hypothetical protein
MIRHLMNYGKEQHILNISEYLETNFTSKDRMRNQEKMKEFSLVIHKEENPIDVTKYYYKILLKVYMSK